MAVAHRTDTNGVPSRWASILRQVIVPLAIVTSVAVYALSFRLPAYALDNENGTFDFLPGYRAFTFSLILLPSIYFAMFLANPIYAAAVLYSLLQRQRDAAFKLALTATGLASIHLFIKGLGQVMAGYYAWLASMGVLALATYLARRAEPLPARGFEVIAVTPPQ